MPVIATLREALLGGPSHRQHRWSLTAVGLLAVLLGISTISYYKMNVGRLLSNINHSSLAINQITAQEIVTPRENLDFFIAGFPKCGTTTLLYTFTQHKETNIGRHEKCIMVDPLISDARAIARFNESVSALSSPEGTKRGTKCPTGVKNVRSLERIQMYAPNVRLIIGVRHPVDWFSSYYNYRITEIYDRSFNETIPPIETLVGSNEWKGVSTDFARFELYLMQLGKTHMSSDNMEEFISRPHMGIRPNSFRIFLYSIEQLENGKSQRSSVFRDDLRDFLGLRDPIEPFGHENLNRFVGPNSHRETINICDARFDDLRALLVKQGKKTAAWIKNRFMKSEDVIVSNPQYFSGLLDRWGVDPCGL